METIKEDNFTGINRDDLYPNLPLRHLTATSIIGDKVHDIEDASMGKVEDIMLDVNSGKIDYLVVELGGFLGIGTKFFALPYNMFKVDAERKLFVFTGTRKMLESAPGFDLNHWPDTNFHKEETYWHFV